MARIIRKTPGGTIVCALLQTTGGIWMYRRCLSIALVALLATFSLATVSTLRAPAAHAAPFCYSTYQEVMSSSGWRYYYTTWGYVRDEVEVVANFDSATGGLCNAFGHFQTYISQSFNQCYYTAYWNFNNGSSSNSGHFNTSRCYITYSGDSVGMKQGSKCFDASMYTNDNGDIGAAAVWCP